MSRGAQVSHSRLFAITKALTKAKFSSTYNLQGLKAVLLVCAAVFTLVGSQIAEAHFVHAPAGKVRFFNVANSQFAPYLKHTSPADQAWMRQHYLRQMVYSPFFDRRLAWYPNGWVYKDAYRVKAGGPIVRKHPDWILKDSRGNKLYIPFGCHDGACPQFAGDFGNPAFRNWWIQRARLAVQNGYKGLRIDDVNMKWWVGNGNGDFVRPFDPRTGKPMTQRNWLRYMAEFMEQIRDAFPGIEIAHNIEWFAQPISNSYVKRELDAANYVNLERGVNDRGLVNGLKHFGTETFFNYIDFIHSRGIGVVIQDYGSNQVQRRYGLAGYLLINNGNDLMSSNQLRWTAPDHWWKGYDLDLGEALGPRYNWKHVIRRDFQCGFVLFNQPGTHVRNFSFNGNLKTIDGKRVHSVRLHARNAAMLRRPCSTF